MKDERVSHWRKSPPPGDAITVLARFSGTCVRVTVRKSQRSRGTGILYSQGAELDPQTNTEVLTGLVGICDREQRGVVWAWGWTTDEAKAFAVAVALRHG